MNHHTPTRTTSAARQRGASMIELLVSVLIFAFGMLGLVGLQNRTLGFGQMSLFRSQATALSDDILDRMRADRANARTGTWSTTLNQPSSAYSAAGTTIAERDLNDWKKQVETLLPKGKGQIEVDAGKVTVTLTWYERDASADTQFQTISGL